MRIIFDGKVYLTQKEMIPVKHVVYRSCPCTQVINTASSNSHSFETTHYIHFNKMRKQKAFLKYNIKIKWNSQILNTSTTIYPCDAVTVFTPYFFVNIRAS